MPWLRVLSSLKSGISAVASAFDSGPDGLDIVLDLLSVLSLGTSGCKKDAATTEGGLECPAPSKYIDVYSIYPSLYKRKCLNWMACKDML